MGRRRMQHTDPKSNQERTDGGESVAELVAGARQAFRQYLELQGDGKFEDAAIQLRRLNNLLESLGVAAKH